MQVLIGIQARSGSKRLPRKAFELIGGKMMLDRVIEASKKAARYSRQRENLNIRIAVLTPVGDPIALAFAGRCDIVEGPENDVLARYAAAAEKYTPDYVIRITGDCPLIPPHIISRMITLATSRAYDYISNVDERFRTDLDGADCEALSVRLLKELAQVATEAADREHVTTLARRSPPAWAKMGAVVNYFDHSGLKLSVDTPEDLKRVREAHESAERKYRAAIMAYGQTCVHQT